MVPVVVDHGDAAGDPQPLEAPLRAQERRQAGAHGIGLRARPTRRGRRGRRVEHVVATRHGDREPAEVHAVLDEACAGLLGAEAHVDDAQVGVLGFPVGPHRRPCGPGQGPRAGVVGAQQGQAVGGPAVQERGERGGHVGLVGVDVVVVHLDVGDHGAVGREVQERAVGLVGLGDEGVPGPVVGAGAASVQRAPDRERRVQPGGLQGHGHHRGGGGLAVRAGDQDPPPAPQHELQQLRADQHGKAQLAGADHLGVGRRDGGRGDDQRGAFHVPGVVAHVDLCAHGLEHQARGAAAQVAAGHGNLALDQQLRQRAHPGAADADEVHPCGSRPSLERGDGGQDRVVGRRDRTHDKTPCRA